MKKMGKSKGGGATSYKSSREDGASGKQRNSQHERKVARTPGGDVQRGRGSPRGARN